MVEPAYQELLKSDIPHVSQDGVHVAVIAGESYGARVSVFFPCMSTSLSSSSALSLYLHSSTLILISSLLSLKKYKESTAIIIVLCPQSPVRTRTPTMYLDFKLDIGATMTQPVAEGWNGFIYVLKGEGKFGGGDSWTESDAHHTLVLGQGDHIQAKNTVSIRVIAILD